MDKMVSYSLKTSNLKLKGGDFNGSSNWDEAIMEYGGIMENNQYMAFDCDGIEVVIDFELCVSGQVVYDRGDYLTPPFKDIDVSEISVSISSLVVDGWEVEMTDEINKFFIEVVKSNL